MVCRALILCAVTWEDFGDSKVDRGPSTKCGNRFPPRSLGGPSRLAACTSQGDLVQSGVLHFARRKGGRDEEEIRRATRTGGGGRVVPLPSSPKEGNAPCVPRVVLFLCHLREGATCSMVYFQFLFLCISVPMPSSTICAVRSLSCPSRLPLSVTVISSETCRDERI